MSKVKTNASKKRFWRGIAVTSLTFSILFSVGYKVANNYAPVINSTLHTTPYKEVEVEGGEEIDSNYFPSSFSSQEEVTANGKAVSYEVESEGLVLMKNNGALPLKSGTKISTVFQDSVEFGYGSSGSGAIDPSKYSDLKTALEGAGFGVNETLWNFYKSNPPGQALTYDRKSNPLYKVNTLAWSAYSQEAKTSISATGGTAMVVLKRLGGEGNDVSAAKSDGYDGSYLSLTKNEIEILAELTKLKQAGDIENIVVIMNSAQVIQSAFLEDNWTVTLDGTSYTVNVDACMWVGNVGIGGIFAMADALKGDVNPSGRLPDTYVKDNFSSPAMASWIKQNDTGRFSTVYENAGDLDATQKYYGVYVEGIYVGYRYYETRYEDAVLGKDNVGEYDYNEVVSRPFGYGLSYTDFEYSNYTVSEKENGDYEVSVTVTNVGELPGKNSVLIYLQKPYTQYDIDNGVEKASVELVGFTKTGMLAAGANETVTVTVEKENFKTYDANGYKTYILEEGDYYLATGDNAHDALNNILAAKGKTTADGMDKDGDAALVQKVGENITLDHTMYATNANNVSITNKLDFADINKYEGRGENEVTYVTRNDWKGTFPTQKIVLTATEQMKADLVNGKPIEEDPNATMPTYGADNGLSLIMLRGMDYNAEAWESLLDQMTWEEQLKLVATAGYGSSGAVSVTLPPVSAKDGPTAVVDSTDNVSFPSEGIWAASFNKELIQKVGDALAEDARSTAVTEDNPKGVTGLYAPGINIHRTPFGGRSHEYFSEDPFLSGVAVEYEIKGLQNKGIIPYIKHYVFNDEEDNRIGVGIWLNEQSAREIYLKPFEYAVKGTHGSGHGVMSSFNRAGCIWTSASEALMMEILRDEWGFDGTVLTDMAMGQYSYMTFDSFVYGTDLFLDPSGSVEALDNYQYSATPTFRQAIREATHRHLYTVVNYCAAMNGYDSSIRLVEVLTWWQMAIIALIIIPTVIGGISLIMTFVYIIKCGKENKKESIEPYYQR